MNARILNFHPLALITYLIILPITTIAGPLSDVPLYLMTKADSNVLFDLSIEWPSAGAAYNDQPDASVGCSGRAAAETVGVVTYNFIGTCYSRNRIYVGYFDPEKCYDYVNNQFEPAGLASANAATEHQCLGAVNNKWSGNLLNWATMSAIDEFRWAITGGNRYTDTATLTILERTMLTDGNLANGTSVFPIKKLDKTLNEDPSKVTPYGANTLYIKNHGVQFDVGTTPAATDALNIYAHVKVCDTAIGLEDNCKAHGTNYKPEGLIQTYGDRMRFGVISYILDNTLERDGGVLRSRMKYTSPKKYDTSSGYIDNPNKEWSTTDGTFIVNPDSADATASNVTNSGVINFINKFGANGYKFYDPIGELYYEALRYFKNKGPTPEYSMGITDAMKDGFPAIATWDDPIQFSCQKNFIIGINDANPWVDKHLPGTYFNTSLKTAIGGADRFKGAPIITGTICPGDSVGTPTVLCSDATASTAEVCQSASQCYWKVTGSDFGEPSNPDSTINVRTLTNTVGSLEGINGTTRCIGGTIGTYDGPIWPGSNKALANLGEVLGTCPWMPKQNSYYIAGLSYYANTQDIRADITGKQTISTYILDTQEYTDNPLLGQMNMLWLTGKYGGFVDKNNSNSPDLANEWDVNGDGQPDNYVLANRADVMIKGLTDAFSQVAGRTPTAASVAANSSYFNSSNKIYQAGFNSADWSGNLRAYGVTFSGSVNTTADWDAGNVLKTSPAPSSRVIYTYNSTATTPDGALFTWADLNTSQQSALNKNALGDVDNLGQNRLDYLRGVTTNEGTGTGKFRTRTTPLGDIIDSAPIYVGATPSGGHADSSYLTFWNDIQSLNSGVGRLPMVYVGSNDGMLHGFSAADGVEKLAYVPNILFPKLSLLTSQDYTHNYYVNGATTVTDAQISISGTPTWRTVLVGSLRGGGQGMYALDVTNPANFTASSGGAAATVLWEFSDKDDADLGFTYSDPQIVKLKDGKWWVVIGNGYNSTDADSYRSTTGYGVIYLLRLEGPTGTNGAWVSGTDYVKFTTLQGTTTVPNGVATPLVADIDLDGMADYIYAGDLLGIIWKLNVTNANPGNWVFGFGSSANPVPLFTANDSSNTTQPITAQLELTKHPLGGYIVLTGTGKYLESTDSLAPYQTQTFYGVWDKNDGATTVTRSNLLQQNLVDVVTNAGTDYVITSDSQPDYTANHHLGWYLDLQNTGATRGERVVFKPLVQGIKRVDFVSLIPNSDPCGTLGTSYFYILNAITGSRLEISPFDTNADLKFTTADMITLNDGHTIRVASGRRDKSIGITALPTGLSENMNGVTILRNIFTGTGDGNVDPENNKRTVVTAGIPTGRLSWREILTN